MARIVRNLNERAVRSRNVVLAAGFFDGVHRGHCSVIRRALSLAKARGAETWVLTFDVHPRRVLNPEEAPSILTSSDHKVALLSEMGVDGCIVLRFTARLARQSPEAFVARLAAAVPGLSGVVVGENWRFGRGRRGTPGLLSKLGRRHGFDLTLAPPATWRGDEVSSTRIRNAVAAGKLGEARRMLGRPFSILGTVIPGRRIGRTLGLPTANLDPHNEVRPPKGVYVALARMSLGWYWGVVNLGIRPTFSPRGQRTPSLELHMPGITQNLYGRNVEVFFMARLRAERTFPGLDALKSQVGRDIERARAWLRLEAASGRLKRKMFFGALQGTVNPI